MKFLSNSKTWTVTEDNVLISAVKKYGGNNWHKVCSLLPRKNAEQCRLRWKNYTNPSIKKDKFTEEERDNLIYMYKKFPNQWATISKGVKNRTPQQCKDEFDLIIKEKLDNGSSESISSEEDNYISEDDIEEKNIHKEPININKKLKTCKNLNKTEKEKYGNYIEQDKETIEETKARIANSLGRKSVRKLRQVEMENLRGQILEEKRFELEIAGIPLFHLEKEIELMKRKTMKYKKDYK